MKPTRQLHEFGQSLWLDNITRDLLDSGTLERYIAEESITGLTSNPTIFDKAIGASADYDDDIAAGKRAGKKDEEVFFALALADLRRAADLFAPIHARTDGVDGWVSLEVSRCWPAIRMPPLSKPRRCMPGRSERIFSSRSPGRTRACRPSRSASLPVCPST